MLSHHPSAATLERCLLRDLPPAQQEATAAHARDCLPCRRQLEALSRERAAFLEAMPFESLQPALERARPRPTWPRKAAVAALALAAAVVAVVFVPRTPAETAETVRFKGAGLSVYRSRGGAVTLLGADDKLAAGDAVRLVVATDAPGEWMAWAIDSAGRLDRVLDRPVTLERGAIPLPGSVVVEAPCLRTWFVAAKVRGSLEAHEAELAEALRTGTFPRRGARANEAIADAWCE